MQLLIENRTVWRMGFVIMRIVIKISFCFLKCLTSEQSMEELSFKKLIISSASERET